MFVVITGDIPYEYLGNNVVSTPEQLIQNASPIKRKSGRSLFANSMHAMSVQTFFARLDGEVKMY
jgi:hypothetical protein